MYRRMVAAFLVGSLILSPGCYPWAAGTDRQQIRASHRIEGRPRNPTHAERTESCRGLGVFLMQAGGTSLTAYGALYLGAPEGEGEDLLYASLGLMAVGGLVYLFSPGLAGRDSKRTQFSIAPNGCRFTYRF